MGLFDCWPTNQASCPIFLPAGELFPEFLLLDWRAMLPDSIMIPVSRNTGRCTDPCAGQYPDIPVIYQLVAKLIKLFCKFYVCSRRYFEIRPVPIQVDTIFMGLQLQQGLLSVPGRVKPIKWFSISNTWASSEFNARSAAARSKR